MEEVSPVFEEALSSNLLWKCPRQGAVVYLMMKRDTFDLHICKNFNSKPWLCVYLPLLFVYLGGSRSPTLGCVCLVLLSLNWSYRDVEPAHGGHAVPLLFECGWDVLLCLVLCRCLRTTDNQLQHMTLSACISFCVDDKHNLVESIFKSTICHGVCLCVCVCVCATLTCFLVLTSCGYFAAAFPSLTGAGGNASGFCSGHLSVPGSTVSLPAPRTHSCFGCVSRRGVETRLALHSAFLSHDSAQSHCCNKPGNATTHTHTYTHPHTHTWLTFSHWNTFTGL